MTSAIEQARLRVKRSRWIPLYLCGLLLAYGCATHHPLLMQDVEKQHPNPQTLQTK